MSNKRAAKRLAKRNARVPQHDRIMRNRIKVRAIMRDKERAEEEKEQNK